MNARLQGLKAGVISTGRGRGRRKVEVKVSSLDDGSWRPEANGLETRLVGTTGVSATGVRGVEAREAAKRPQTNSDPVPNVHSAQPENPGSEQSRLPVGEGWGAGRGRVHPAEWGPERGF